MKSLQAQNGQGVFNTLAQVGTASIENTGFLLRGPGSDLGDIQYRKKRSKRKLITQKLALSLLEVSDKFGDPDIKKGYRNTFYCQNKVYSANGKLYSKYCKNRFCTLCCAIRKAVLINKY